MNDQEMRQTIRDRALRSCVFLLSSFLEGGEGEVPPVTEASPAADQAQSLECLANGLAPIREDLCRMEPNAQQKRELLHLINAVEEAYLRRFPSVAPRASAVSAIDGARFLATCGQPGPVSNSGTTFLAGYCKSLASILWFETTLAHYVDRARRTARASHVAPSISAFSPHVLC